VSKQKTHFVLSSIEAAGTRMSIEFQEEDDGSTVNAAREHGFSKLVSGKKRKGEKEEERERKRT
jgi:hypothetical protein